MVDSTSSPEQQFFRRPDTYVAMQGGLFGLSPVEDEEDGQKAGKARDPEDEVLVKIEKSCA